MAILKLPTMEAVTRDLLDQPAALAREVERLGEAVLQGDSSNKMVLWRLAEVENEMRAGGRHSTQIAQQLIELASSPADKGGQTGSSTEGGKVDEG
ncbi:MAG: hypothetical protein SGPRY_006287 [Prymnesium sp.]